MEKWVWIHCVLREVTALRHTPSPGRFAKTKKGQKAFVPKRVTDTYEVRLETFTEEVV